ncbi:LacI family DNA-binding transcriptional regulator [Lacrimispora sp.]|uniref:LacI family DNA-binding transcriptional regulator n=1 Tax=Lacrimispora sp. TaxID=2719234 RepID=UPI0029E177AF|nr:LacI family transcriptional regulator, purine nucleotide synthesis repressor [Lacrimispora sp.]
MKKIVRLTDIAEKLQVSTVAVSNALSGQKGVSDELRARIKQVASEMGYQPKGTSSPGKKLWNVGVIISEKYLGEYPSYYWKVYQELSLIAGIHNCVILFEVLRHEWEAALELPLLAKEQQIQGLLIIGDIGKPYLEFLSRQPQIPVVLVDFMKKGIRMPSVMADNYYGMYKMVNYLVDHGHCEIAYVGTLMASNSITDRYFGYRKALMENGILFREDWGINDRTMEGQIGNIQLPEQMPTAFACNCDLTASELINILEEKGYRIPEDISVVGFDNYLFEGLCDVKITSYEVDIKEMVRCAIKMVVSLAEHGKASTDMCLVSGKVVEKNSVKDIK